MQSIVRTSPNIALIKYWGKRNTIKNLPAVDSISITLDNLWTEMNVIFSSDLSNDELFINEKKQNNISRVKNCIDSICGEQRDYASIMSRCNFPISAGLASSSSSFSALVVAINSLMKKKWNTQLLANQAGSVSGSAARSILGGIVKLNNEPEKIRITQLLSPNDWPLRVVIAITDKKEKAISSSKAMKLSADTSPFYSSWVEDQNDDIKEANSFISKKDFEGLASISEHNCMKMHSIMWTTRPSIVYWNSTTIDCMHAIRDLQRNGESVFFTIDAGPQIKAICLPENEEKIAKKLNEIKGVQSIMTSGLGSGPIIEK
ncbi:MAG: diphosphomevalonate decarboxylase [Gammaproteobacteria bacterium]|nr:MAG: diphosphomevalonate decarboxylase [Gammaproteobacteria bacterium]|tara:strand:+ start:802 stop:1755 length:954 start_codon:yes stop_codon:yes gene_type:complete